jgi:class 3 adenylate cyclase
MVIYLKKSKIFGRDIIAGLVLALLCYAFQHSSGFLTSIFRFPIDFVSLGNNDTRWHASVDGLSNGNYFVSVGEPKGICSLSIDGKEVDSSKGVMPNVHKSLFLGSAFIVGPLSHPKEIDIMCDTQKGFVGLTHAPVIVKYKIGILLQLWRELTDLLMGPIASILIIFSFVFRLKRKGSFNSYIAVSPFESWKYFFFGLVSFFYSLSLALVTRFFLDGYAATFFHVFIRNIFSLSVLTLFTIKEINNKVLLGFQVILASIVIYWGVYLPDTFVLFYRWQFSFFPFATGLVAFKLFSKEARSQSVVILRRILFAWTILQCLELAANWTNYGTYTAPSVVLLLCISAFSLRMLERQKALNVEVAASKILSVIESNEPIEKVLKETAIIAMWEAKYGRVSSYVDGFCIGAIETPGKSFFRVTESGYKKDTSIDSIINFSEDRGVIMAEAIKLQKPILRVGLIDQAWFLVVPIGKHACINLSDDHPKSNFLAYESFEIIQRILPSLLSLERRLIDLGFLQGAALQKLRSKRGDGKWEEEFGALFVDINDYSRFADTFGDAFTTFISDIYLPAFIKAVSKFSVSEHVAGDEVYFIVTKDLLGDNLDIKQAVVETLSSIDKFVYNEGAKLCIASGFSPVTTSIGVNVGLGSIVCDPVSVRTAGRLVNHAKRLQEEAGNGGILLGAASQLVLDGSPFLLGEKILIQRKKQVVWGQRVLRRLRPESKHHEAS